MSLKDVAKTNHHAWEKMKNLSLILIFILSFLLTAQEEELWKARVKQLELQVQKLTQEVLELRSEVQSQKKEITKKVNKESPEEIYKDIIDSLKRSEDDTFLNRFYKNIRSYKIYFGGYFEFQLEQQESVAEESIFDLSQIALHLRAPIAEMFSIDTEIRLTKEDEFDLNFAVFNWEVSPSFNLKAGVIPTPFGNFNRHYAPPDQPIASVPLLNQYIIPLFWSEPGIGISGEQPLYFLPLNISYEGLISNGLNQEAFSSIDGNKEGTPDLNEDNNQDLQFTGNIRISPDLALKTLALHVGLSGIIGEYDDLNRNQFRGYAIDGLFRVGPFSAIGDHDFVEVSGEFAEIEAEGSDVVRASNNNFSPEQRGYYLRAQYEFFPESWREIEDSIFDEESSFSFVFQYDRLDLDTRKRGASLLDDRSIYTIGWSFRPIVTTVFRLEYSIIRDRFPKTNRNNRFVASFATFF